MTPQEKQRFLEQLVLRVHQILDRGKPTNIILYLCRYEQGTGKSLPPRAEVRELGLYTTE